MNKRACHAMGNNDLAFYPVDNSRWRDLEQLFESRGGPHYCWCMAWRRKPPPDSATGAAPKKQLLKEALHERVARAVPIGIVACSEGEPVGWCSVAPRPTFRKLTGSQHSDNDPDVWSIVCFFVKRKMRGHGLSDMLLSAAVDYARESGAATVEAYPVDRQSPTYRFMGIVDQFSRIGFEYVGPAGSRRHIMRLELS